MREKVLDYIREQGLIRAGDRVAVAVSGGADSVALLRVLLELKGELGIVLSVAHFNHQLRGEQSDADQAFVTHLAKECGLEIFVAHGNVRDHASSARLSIEAAARRLRYRWFAEIAREHRLDAVATAHTLDDQAETVLLKFLRGAGTRGLAAIYPSVQMTTGDNLASQPDAGKTPSPAEAEPNLEKDAPDATLKAGSALSLSYVDPKGVSTGVPSAVRVVRPLLGIRRQEVEAYLTQLGQAWREDESNLDRRYRRNRVRHDLLPLLEREFNPNIRSVLSGLADVARGEEAYWRVLVGLELRARTTELHAAGEAGLAAESRLDLNGFAGLPLAIQRRLLKKFAEENDLALDFESVERLRFCALGEIAGVELPGNIIASVTGSGLSFGPPATSTGASYSYVLPVPGEVAIPEAGLRLRAFVVSPEFANEAEPGTLLSLELVGPQLTIRNWAPGDRFWPAHSRSEEKLKRLFLEKKVAAAQRPAWPVGVCDGRTVWVRGFPVASTHQWRGTGQALQIEVLEV